MSEFEHRLALVEFMAAQFGAESVSELRERVADIKPGFGEDGHSDFYRRLRTYDLEFEAETLQKYDANIKKYEKRLRTDRSFVVEFRPFQYLALLLTERYLDWYFSDADSLHQAFTQYVAARNDGAPTYEEKLLQPQADDMAKVAYWMATGSGKTFILHANYWQFHRYNDDPLDKTILIAPRDGLAKQHVEEFERSGITAERVTGESIATTFQRDLDVVVLPISKLREESGKTTIAASALIGRNLVFVDEGHKGTSSGEEWLQRRDTVTEGGFVFEYSATFGQALDASDNKELTDEYATSIIFDYSFRHFHKDGYGKKYDILNIPTAPGEKERRQYLTANLLAFFEQRACYERHPDVMDEYNIEDPVWVFVGRTVSSTGGSGFSENEASDIIMILEFLDQFLREPERSTAVIEEILHGEPLLTDEDEQPLFHSRFDRLREQYSSPVEVYEHVRSSVFNTSRTSRLQVVDLVTVDGEMGLRAGPNAPFFGVINIGNTNQFTNALEDAVPDLPVTQTRFTSSLFERLQNPDSSIRLLMGAKKFIEGWDNPRVTSMGLLNVGRSKGSEIIQIFGRGVRLQGKYNDLRRSDALDDTAPSVLDPVETLRIFGVRADYVAEFRDELEREGIPTNHHSAEVPTKMTTDVSELDLKLPKQAPEQSFPDEAVVILDGSLTASPPKVDLYETVQATTSDGLTEKIINESQNLDPDAIEALDWELVRDRLLDYKSQNGYSNLIITKAGIKQVITEEHYNLYCPSQYTTFTDRESYHRFVETVTRIVRRYASGLYADAERAWQGENMQMDRLRETDQNVDFGGYDIRISERAPDAVFESLDALLADMEAVYDGTCSGADAIPRVYYDDHIYKPLFAEGHDEVSISPPPLNEGEEQFIRDLNAFLSANPDRVDGKDVYLLRNQSRKGVGFFESSNFYPDFILWLVDEDGFQQVIFLDPHGMVHEFERLDSEKVRLHEEIKTLENKIGDAQVQLESFLISTTRWADLRTTVGDTTRTEFEQNHVLFQELSYVEQIFDIIEDARQTDAIE